MATWLFVDASFTFQNLFREPGATDLHHFWTLRSLVEAFAEADFQVALQLYIYIRQEDPFALLPRVRHTSVAPLLLLLSLEHLGAGGPLSG